MEAGGGRLHWGAFPVVALASTIALEQGERLSLAQAFDGIQAEFGVSDLALGALAAAMVLVGVIGGFPFGALADRWRRVTLMVIAMVVWTACMGLNAIAPGVRRSSSSAGWASASSRPTARRATR